MAAGYTAPDNAGIAAIQVKTDLLPADPAATSDLIPLATRLEQTATLASVAAQLAAAAAP